MVADWKGFCVWVCIVCNTVYRLSLIFFILFVTQTSSWCIKEANISVEWRVCGGAVCSLLVDQLQRDALQLSACVTKISLCYFGDVLMSRFGAGAGALTPPLRADPQKGPRLFRLRVFSRSFHNGPIQWIQLQGGGQLCLLNSAGRPVRFIHHIANQSDNLFHVGTHEADVCLV